MDDALIDRWKQGEPAATTAVRNALRTVAERVLSNPALRHAEGTGGRRLVEDEERRRELTANVAKEVMARGGDSAATLNAIALMTASRHAVEAVRVGRPLAGSAHLPPPVAVAMALTPEAMNPAQRDAMSRHLETCSACSDDCRLVREIVRAAATSSRDSSAAELEEAVHESAEPYSRDITDSSGGAMAAAMAAAAAEVDERESESTSPTPGAESPRRAQPGRPPPRPSQRVTITPTQQTAGFDWRAAAVLGGLALISYWYWSSERRGALQKEVDPDIAALADRTPPKIAENEAVPKYAEDGAALLKRGDCRTAGARFRTARRSHPEDRRLWVLEGGSFVCAGDGAAALQSLGEIAKDPEATPAALWFHAQALLLNGSVGPALDALDRVADSGSPYAARARTQRDAVKAR